MSPWKRIASLEDCPPGSTTEWVVDDDIVALFNVDGTLYALDGICPHQGGPLGQGSLTGHIVTCPWHGWQFDVRDGQHQASAALRHPRWEVKVDGDDVFVRKLDPKPDG